MPIDVPYASDARLGDELILVLTSGQDAAGTLHQTASVVDGRGTVTWSVDLGESALVWTDPQVDFLAYTDLSTGAQVVRDVKGPGIRVVEGDLVDLAPVAGGRLAHLHASGRLSYSDNPLANTR